MFRKRGNGACTHTVCDIVAKNRPERTIGFLCETILVFERHFGDDHKEEIREMSLDALAKFGPGTAFERDERMLPVYRILAKYSKSMTPSELYDRLYEKNLFGTSAQFYADWADTHLAAGNPMRAAQIIAHAISAIGIGHPVLESLKETVDRVIAERIGGRVDGGGGGGMNSNPPPPSAARSLDAQMADMRVGSFVGRPPPQQLMQPQHPSQWLAPPPSGAMRRVFSPIQAPRGPSAAAAAAQATAGPDAVEKDFPPLPSASSRRTTKPETKPAPPTNEESDDSNNKENVRPLMAFVLPSMADPPPYSPDMISPSLAQMKPGRPNNFYLPPVFSFADATRGTKPPQ